MRLAMIKNLSQCWQTNIACDLLITPVVLGHGVLGSLRDYQWTNKALSRPLKGVSIPLPGHGQFRDCSSKIKYSDASIDSGDPMGSWSSSDPASSPDELPQASLTKDKFIVWDWIHGTHQRCSLTSKLPPAIVGHPDKMPTNKEEAEAKFEAYGL
ncbi:hypothetical protein SELMODRAFT_418130 [Selaginella moellendorffii]|uniref:Uncharacterized protein n=1 Tax=Selaginella moellendorffii TaxID=88036 RepID=D8S4S4_SELML|nr:hypothetical protein SELMODRAFT_418130 [Selaginella moellendorffii]